MPVPDNGYKIALAPSWEGRSFTDQFQQQRPDCLSSTDFPTAMHNTAGMAGEAAGLELLGVFLSPAWHIQQQLELERGSSAPPPPARCPICFSDRQLWNSSSWQLKDCYCRFSEPRKNKPRKKEKVLSKQGLSCHQHKYHTNTCGPWRQGLKDTVTILGHRWLWDTISWWITLRRACLLQSMDLEKDFSIIADQQLNMTSQHDGWQKRSNELFGYIYRENGALEWVFFV